MEWQGIHQNRYILCQQPNMFCLWVSEYGHKRFVGEEMDMSELTPVEIVGYEVDEAGSPLALDNG